MTQINASEDIFSAEEILEYERAQDATDLMAVLLRIALFGDKKLRIEDPAIGAVAMFGIPHMTAHTAIQIIKFDNGQYVLITSSDGQGVATDRGLPLKD